MSSEAKKPRMWPFWVILVINVALWLFAFFSDGDMRQDNYLKAMAFLLFSLPATLVWFIFFSRLSKQTRKRGVGLFLLGFAVFFFFFEFSDLSGDFVPILTYRWAKTYADMDSEAKTSTTSVVTAAGEADFPGFMGPDGDNQIKGTLLATDWKAHAPQEKWRIPIGAGWSGFAVVGKLAVTQEQRGQKQMITCYDLERGTAVWAADGGEPFVSVIGGDGPRSTPTVADGRVYTIGAQGQLHCLELATGRQVWFVDTLKDNKGRLPEWGYSSSPLVYDELVVVSPGGPDSRSLVAYNRVDGSFVWGGGNDSPGYSTPQLRTIAGVPQIVVVNGMSVAAHDPQTGAILWEVPWGDGHPNAANPLLLAGNRLLVSSGYGIGSALYQISAETEKLGVTKLYETKRLKAKFANYVAYEGYVYGLDDGILTCIDPATGERKWKRGRYGHGQMLLVEDKLLIQSEKGALALVDPSPEEFRDLSSIDVLGGKAWNSMAISGNLVLMRNHKEAVCLELARRGN